MAQFDSKWQEVELELQQGTLPCKAANLYHCLFSAWAHISSSETAAPVSSLQQLLSCICVSALECQHWALCDAPCDLLLRPVAAYVKNNSLEGTLQDSLAASDAKDKELQEALVQLVSLLCQPLCCNQHTRLQAGLHACTAGPMLEMHCIKFTLLETPSTF